MSKVITFSRVFPSYHPKAGQPTYFVEKVHKSLDQVLKHSGWNKLERLFYTSFDFSNYAECNPKHHTIRAGHRWKAGDWFSPRVWSGKPYNSKQVAFAPDIRIKKTWDFEISGQDGKFFIDGSPFTSLGMFVSELATNDGLTSEDFKAWFKHPKPFTGQIICWNESIEY